MARFTGKQRREIERAIGHLQRAAKFLAQPRVAVATRDDRATTTAHYTRADGGVLYEINKEIGSDLCGLDMGLRALRDLIEQDLEKAG
jgi:hypothetical protein